MLASPLAGKPSEEEFEDEVFSEQHSAIRGSQRAEDRAKRIRRSRNRDEWKGNDICPNNADYVDDLPILH